MSKARTLKEIEDRKSRYSRYIWAAIAAAFIGIVLGIAVYIYLGLPSFFLFEKLINSLLMSSFVIAIISIVVSYLSKSSVMRGEYRSAERLLPA
ncbi:MAG: hypothetical protein JZD41_00770, partial [Thermoproteus sp.]|nr:hypothetical protein [Thermoproteus sp.]